MADVTTGHEGLLRKGVHSRGRAYLYLEEVEQRGHEDERKVYEL